jgi:hypothetical protein
MAFLLAQMVFANALRNGTARSGNTVQQVIMKGVALVVTIIMLVISGYFTAYLVPPVLSTFATAVLTSVSSVIVTLFQTVLSLVFLTVIILLYLALIVETFSSFA